MALGNVCLVELASGGKALVQSIRADLRGSSLRGTIAYLEDERSRRSSVSFPFSEVAAVALIYDCDEERVLALNTDYVAKQEAAAEAALGLRSGSLPLALGRSYQARLPNGSEYSGTLVETIKSPHGLDLVVLELSDGARVALKLSEAVLTRL